MYVCGVSRSSKFALKRHQQHEHPSDAKPATHLSEVVVAVPTVTVPQKCVKNTRVVTITATQQPKSTQTRHHPDRIALDLIICRLQSRYQQNLDYFSQSSAEIADQLQQETRSYELGERCTSQLQSRLRHLLMTRAQCVSRRLRLEDPPTSCNPSHTVAAP